MVNDDQTLEGVDVLIEDGVIKEVGQELEADEETKVLDVSGKLVMPGGIDASVHFHSQSRNLVS